MLSAMLFFLPSWAQDVETTETQTESLETGDAPSDTEARPFDPFTDWETHELDNGLRVWIKPWPSAESTFVDVSVPVGARQDPEGLEGTAHYLEHVLFTSVPGLTETEFKNRIRDLGGRHNGATNWVRTHYYAEVPNSHWVDGVQWVHDVVFDKNFDTENIVNQRDPILLEGGAEMKPKTPLDLFRELAEAPWMPLPEFEQRELGFPHYDRPTLGTWESLHRIEPDDVIAFYERYYHPQNMLLVVAGDVDANEVLAEATRVFGGHPRTAERHVYAKEATHRKGRRVRHTWDYRGDAHYLRTIKLYDASPDDQLVAEVLARMVREHLRERLRLGETKSVYSVKVWVDNMFGNRWMQIEAGCAADRLELVRQEVEDILARLAAGDDVERFEVLRQRAMSAARLALTDPKTAVERMVLRKGQFAAEVRPAFPDLSTTASTLTAASLGKWMQEHLTDEGTGEELARPDPISEAWLLPMLFGVGWLVLWSARRLLTTPIDLTRLRYLRKIRYPIWAWFLLFVLTPVVWLLGTQVLTFAGLRVRDAASVVPLYPLQFSLQLLELALTVAWFVAIPTLIPRKVLLLEHEWRIKFWSYRSWVYRYDDVEAIEVTRLLPLWARGRLLTLLLWPGLFIEGLYVKVGRWAWFLHTGDDEELAEAFRKLEGRR